MATTADFWNGKRVLITGATGFIGSWLTKALIEKNAKVTVLARDFLPDSMFNQPEIKQKLHAVVDGDVTNYDTVDRALNEYEIDLCFHLAAQAIIGVANKSPLSTFETNIKGTWNVLEACRRLSTRVVVASTDKAYGEKKQLPYTEEQSLDANHPYDASKACEDILARTYHNTYGLPVAVTRCTNVYGGGDLNFSRIIPDAMRAAYYDQPLLIRSDGTPIRDYMYALDAVSAYLTLAENIDRMKGEAFNFGTNKPINVLELVKKILEVTGKKNLEIKVLGTATGEISKQYMSSAKAEKILGWKPKYSLDEGLRLTYEWYANFFSQKKRGE